MNFNEEENCINAHLRVTVLISLHKQMGRTELLPFTPNVCVLRCRRVGLRRELCSALGAATGEDLAAVGGSHSLSEAMHLGSVTLSGLIGTQHLRVHLLLDYAQQPDSGRSNRKSSCAGMDAISKHGCAIDIISQHPVESQPEVLNFVRKFRAFL